MIGDDSTTDLRAGDWRDVLAGEETDLLLTDPPFSERTHVGHNALPSRGELDARYDGSRRSALTYAHWTARDVAEFVGHWSPRTRGWFCAMTSHDLVPAWEEALGRAGRYVFAPLPCVIRGMTVRRCGDGPSSWTVWLIVARPRTRAFARWGTLPGAYVTGTGARLPGEAKRSVSRKPLELVSAIVRDYSRAEDRVCDPCAGLGTTLLAARALARPCVGAEVEPSTHASAAALLRASWHAERANDPAELL